MDASLLTPSRFIKSEEFLGKDVTYTITRVVLDKLEGRKGTQTKGIVFFSETDKGWVLNRTNVECLKGMWGRETDHWLNKRVTLYPEPMRDSFTGEDITGIRVRGSPDLDADTTVSIQLPQKKPVQKKLLRTGKANGVKPGPMSDPDTEATLIRGRIAKCASVADLDDAWTSGMGDKIRRLPGDLAGTLEREFKARKGELRAVAAPPASAPPPTDEVPY